jgi:hypothetical protein
MDFIASLPNPMSKLSFRIGAQIIEKPQSQPLAIKPDRKRIVFTQQPSRIKKTYSSFQVKPHTQLKNDKIDQFADVIAETFQELAERFKAGSLHDPERIFFETVITSKSYKTYVTTNTHLIETLRQQTQIVWKDVTLEDMEEDCFNLTIEDTEGYDFKLRYPFFLSLKTDRRLTELPLSEILELTRFMQEGDRIMIQFGFQAAEKDWYKDAMEDRKYFDKKRPHGWKKGPEINEASEKKSMEYGYDFVLRVTVTSPEGRRRNRISRGIILALKQLNLDNELVEKRIKKTKLNSWLGDIQKRKIRIPFLFGKRNIITNSEIAHFIKLPQRQLQELYPIIDTIKQKEVKIPEELTQKGIKSVRIGYVTEKGEKKLAQVPLEGYNTISQKAVYDALCTFTFSQGKQGSGKSEGYGTVWAYDMVMSGFSVIIIDTADGQVLRNFVNCLPEEYPEEKLHLLNFDNKAWPIPTGWEDVYGRSFGGSNDDDELQALEISERITSRFIGFINKQSSGEFTDQMVQYVVSCMRAITTGNRWSFLDLELALTSPSYREQLVGRDEVQKMPDVVRDLLTLQDKAERGSLDSFIAPIISRLRVLSGTQFMTNLFFQEPKLEGSGKPVLDLRKIMDNPEGGYGHVVCIQASFDAWQEAQSTILGFFNDKIDFNSFSRIEIDQDERKPCLKWIDEPHKIKHTIADNLEQTAVEFRKYRVKSLLTGHTIDQLGKAAHAVLAGGAQITSYKTEELKDLDRFAHAFAPYDDARSLYEMLPDKHVAVNKVRLPSGKDCPAFIAEMVAPPKEVKDRRYAWEVSAKKYGRPWKDVRDGIQLKRFIYAELDSKWYETKEAAKEAEKQIKKETKAKKERT